MAKQGSACGYDSAVGHSHTTIILPPTSKVGYGGDSLTNAVIWSIKAQNERRGEMPQDSRRREKQRGVRRMIKSREQGLVHEMYVQE